MIQKMMDRRVAHPEIRPDFSISEERLRRWLRLLHHPDKLAGFGIEELVVAHGDLPQNRSPLAIGQAGSRIILDAIERLRPPEPASRDQSLPFLVLDRCFVSGAGAKMFQAAAALGLSERQLSRERTRAIRLLKAELEEVPDVPHEPDYASLPIPAIGGFLDRPSEMNELKTALASSGVVIVHGPPGVGKTTLVAEVVANLTPGRPVLWYRFRDGVNATLNAVLFEMADYLRSRGVNDLADYIGSAPSAVESAVATRLTIRLLAEDDHLLVLDDFQVVEGDGALRGLVEEIGERLPRVHVILVTRHRDLGIAGASSVEVGPLAKSQTRALLTKLDVTCSDEMVDGLHSWTNGNPHMLKLAASWLRSATPDQAAARVRSLGDQTDVRTFLLEHVTRLIDNDDRDILEGASVFRTLFNDDALAFITGKTRGAVVDSTARLVRSYIATRNREGDAALFHHSVREFVYDRIEKTALAELHERAARWFEMHGPADEAAYHRARAAKAFSTSIS